jgi:50S ribosomal protein L16 3-hydroxylase
MPPGLAAIIGPRIADYSEPFAVHGVDVPFAIPMLASLDALLGTWPDHVQVHLPDVADESSSVTATPRDARAMFANGMGLLFDDIQTYTPELVPWLAAIRRDLGLSTLTHQRCLVYATPAGKGTAPHFDQNINVVLQLHGTKTWSLARNAHVVHPMTRHTIGQRVDAELGSYAQLPMPSELPAERTEIVLEPGSVLCVPRGVWHATHATTDSLQLNFTFSPPTWIDVFTAALRSKLALSTRWRETATPVSSETFDALLRELAQDSVHWNATDILAVTES